MFFGGASILRSLWGCALALAYFLVLIENVCFDVFGVVGWPGIIAPLLEALDQLRCFFCLRLLLGAPSMVIFLFSVIVLFRVVIYSLVGGTVARLLVLVFSRSG